MQEETTPMEETEETSSPEEEDTEAGIETPETTPEESAEKSEM